MNRKQWFSFMLAATVAGAAVVNLAATRQCQAQSDPVSVFVDRGYYYGSVYDPRYSDYPTYGQRAYGYGSARGYSYPSYSYPSSGAGRYSYGAAPMYSSQMGPYVTSINGPFGNMYGPYVQRYYGPYGTMTYYGPSGFRGFDR